MTTTISLLHETLELRDRYDEEPSHSSHVAYLALSIYDQFELFQSENEISENVTARMRQLLQAASLLHDIGWSQTPDGKEHHKLSAQLILKHPWKSLEKEEVMLVAQVARYHRKALPHPDHAEYQSLPPTAQRQVCYLGGILRVADALDRAHLQTIQEVRVHVETEKKISFHLHAIRACGPELNAIRDKGDLLEKVTGRTVVCTLKE